MYPAPSSISEETREKTIEVTMLIRVIEIIQRKFVLCFILTLLNKKRGGTESKSYGLGRAGFPLRLPLVADEAVSL